MVESFMSICLSSESSLANAVTRASFRFLLFGLGGEPPLVQSSFKIVPVATASSMDPPTALKSSTVKVSFGSRLWSPVTAIVIVWLETAD
jgi:hypothetical protein